MVRLRVNLTLELYKSFKADLRYVAISLCEATITAQT